MKISNYPIKKVKLNHKQYPAVLKKINNPPKVLFYRGKLNQEIFRKTLAIVGSRRITQYGKRIIDQFVPSLVAEKVTIISGFMYGVDSEAHQKCVEYGGKTIAVLGCGLDIIYPEDNKRLYAKILQTGGLILSEYEPRAKPQLWTFPQRNRIIAGLATLGVLIVEAGKKSGSLITARLAKKQKKELFAIPGPITSSVSVGTNLLIQTGQAKMVLNVNDLLNLPLTSKKEQVNTGFTPMTLNPIEQKIYQALQAEALTTDELARSFNKNIIEISKILSLMSLKGIISESAGKFYI